MSTATLVLPASLACDKVILPQRFLGALIEHAVDSHALVADGFLDDGVDEALFGMELGGDLGAGIDDDGVNKETVLHAIEQCIAESRLAVLAAEGAVGNDAKWRNTAEAKSLEMESI